MVVWREVALVALAFGALGLWRVSDAFLRPGYSLSEPWGDGIGTMGLIFDHAHRFGRAGLKAAFWDLYRSPDIGGGLHAPMVTTTFWRIQFWALGKIFSIDNVYDFLCWSGFALNGLFAYFLTRELGCGRVAASFVGLAVVSLDVFDSRVSGHLTMAFFYYQLLACWLVIRAAKQPTFARMTAASAGLWLSFLGNEYYGYFAVFFCTTLFAGYRLLGERVGLCQMVSAVLRAAGVGTGLMALSYPRMLLGGLLERWGLIADRMPSFAQPDLDFSMYALAHVATIFRPSLSWLAKAIGPFRPDSVEFTFRLGTLIPALASGMLLLLVAFYFRQRSLERKHVLAQCSVWMAAGLVSLLFARTPNHFPSLVPLTRHIAPMFRVGVRAVLFVDIAGLVLLGILFDHFLRRELALWSVVAMRRSSFARLSCAGAMFAACWLGLEDLRPANTGVFSKARASAVPHEPIYDRLASLPEGMVLELPFYLGPADNPETDYLYVANRMYHHKPVLNFMRDPHAQCQAMRFARDVNHPGPQTPSLLRRLGVHYLVIHTLVDRRYELQPYVRNPGLTMIAQEGSVALLEVQQAGAWTASDFLAYYGEACKFEGGLLPTTVESEAIFDPARQTTDRVARFSSVSPGNFITYGPFMVFAPGRYEVTFELRAQLEKADARGLVMRVDVFAEPSGMIVQRDVLREELADGTFHAVVVPFSLSEAGATQFRVTAHAQGTLTVGAITLRGVNVRP